MRASVAVTENSCSIMFLFGLPTDFSDFNSIEAIEKELKKIINKGNS